MEKWEGTDEKEPFSLWEGRGGRRQDMVNATS